MKISEPIIALDFPDKQTTINFLDQFPGDQHLFVKVGMEQYRLSPFFTNRIIKL